MLANDNAILLLNYEDNKHRFTVANKGTHSSISQVKNDIPLCRPKLIISNYEIQREESIKFLGVLLDQHLTWKEHTKLSENKIAKNIGILYKARPYLDKTALLWLYYSYIHSYVNYANTPWCSTNRTYLMKLQIQQKQAIRIIFHESKFAHTGEHFRK